MSDKASQDEVAAARGYENLLVPAAFQQWVAPVLDAARVGVGDRVLDVACGTGVLARGAAARVREGGRVIGVDPSRGMLAVASELGPSVEWQEGVAESLPFPDGSFDVVVSQFGLMFFQDRPTALLEMARVLVPGGRVAIAVWDTLANSPGYADEVDLLERLVGTAAADAVRMPFALGNRAELASLVDNAGLASVEVVTRTGAARFPSIRTMVEADLRGWLPAMGITLTEDRIHHVLQEAERSLARHAGDGGQVQFDMPAHIAIGAKR